VVCISEQILGIVTHCDEGRCAGDGRRPVPRALSIAVSGALRAVEPVAEECGMHGRWLPLEEHYGDVDERAGRHVYELEPAPVRRGDGSAKVTTSVANTPYNTPEPSSLAAAWTGRRGVAQGPSEVGFGEKSHAGIGRRSKMLFKKKLALLLEHPDVMWQNFLALTRSVPRKVYQRRKGIRDQRCSPPW
jgi:hypothetical protein